MKHSTANRAPSTAFLLVASVVCAVAPQLCNAIEPISSPPVVRAHGRPALITTADLADFNDLPAARQKLIEAAIAVARTYSWLPYAVGGAEPALGGMDCSGAMYYVMRQVGLTPPRTAAGQYLWLRDHDRLHLMAPDALTTEHPSMAGLQPGDLLFWSTPRMIDGVPITRITHVAMYLGREKKDGLQVMINSTDGRSYRGTISNGYGVYDLRLPRASSAVKFAGYGTPPGIPDAAPPAAAPP